MVGYERLSRLGCSRVLDGMLSSKSEVVKLYHGSWGRS